MSKTASTGVVDVRYVPTIANTSAPTAAEINAGTNLSGFITRDGVVTPQSGKTIPTAAINNRYDTSVSGSYGGDPISLKLYRDKVSGSDTAWATLPRQTTGYIVIARFGFTSGTPTSADRCEVWPIEVISREMMPTADNEAQRFEVKMAVPTPPNDNAAVA